MAAGARAAAGAVLTASAAVLLVVSSLAASARAEPAAPSAVAGKPRRKGKAPASDAKRPVPSLAADRLETLRGALSGEDDAAALTAAAALGASGATNAVDPLDELLATGCPPARAQAALEALGKLGGAGVALAERAVELLELYAGHHAVELRLGAVKALGAIRDARVVPVLMERLGDAAPEVRAASGEALAARRETKAAPRLFALLKRGDAGAASPLAAIATPDLVPQIAELAGSVDDGILASALGDYVQRDDVPDKLRVDVLRTIGRLGGASATTALVEYIASLPAKDDRPSKREAQKLLDERGSRP